MAPPVDTSMVEWIRSVAESALRVAPDIELLFVTNIRTGELADIGPDGVLNVAQYYTQAEADGIIRSLQDLGLTVRSFFTEREFIAAVTDGSSRTSARQQVVFTTAEGGSGSGRRALIPALCNLLGLPVLNSGAHACSVARHKFHANAILANRGIRVPATWLMRQTGWSDNSRPPDGLRVIIKPTYESMCIGVGRDSVQIVDSEFDLFVRAKRHEFNQPVLVQEFITGDEVGVPILQLNRTYALPVISFLRANGDRYGHLPKTFADENLEHDVSRALFEAPAPRYEAIQSAAVRAFDALEMRGVGRIDLRIDADGRAWVFDTSESPPPVAPTAYSEAMKFLGFSLREMLAGWLGACLLEEGLISGVGPKG